MSLRAEPAGASATGNVLITIPISHYCEKARWALDRAGIGYRERAHLQLIHRIAARRAGGGTTVPVLICADGVLPESRNADGSSAEIKPADILAIKRYVDLHRDSGTPFDIALEGQTAGHDRIKSKEIVGAFAQAGLTWWLESLFDPARSATFGQVRDRIRQGPPRVD